MLWYWFALIGFWLAAVRHVMGVPFSRVLAAHAGDTEAAEDTMVLARLTVRSILRVTPTRRLVHVALIAFGLTMLVALALAGLEMAQAGLFFAVPWVMIAALRLSLANRFAQTAPNAAELVQRLIWHRITVQGIAGVTLFIALLWGAWRNLSLALGV
ncbi:hypothetical protein [Falsirhodobacter sp. alg1]|uniref:hypothetical protein n=1 Tax=Falsirhodobacter sp. alg1 TaxID=1472418 RepID=UPI00128F9C2E|nr:hypothetical protein [Falsirhodobacter sp. alg1]